MKDFGTSALSFLEKLWNLFLKGEGREGLHLSPGQAGPSGEHTGLPDTVIECSADKGERSVGGEGS
jgi:hypothetical protein